MSSINMVPMAHTTNTTESRLCRLSKGLVALAIGMQSNPRLDASSFPTGRRWALKEQLIAALWTASSVGKRGPQARTT